MEFFRSIRVVKLIKLEGWKIVTTKLCLFSLLYTANIWGKIIYYGKVYSYSLATAVMFLTKKGIYVLVHRTLSNPAMCDLRFLSKKKKKTYVVVMFS